MHAIGPSSNLRLVLVINEEEHNRRDAAAQFLTLFAFLAHIPISESIFRCHWEWSESRPEWIHIFSVKNDANSSDEESRSETDDHFRDFISKVNSISLMQSISSGPGARELAFSLHPLICDWLQLRNKGQQRRLFSNECIAMTVNSI